MKSAAGSLDHLFTDQIGGSLSSVGTGLVDGAKDVWSSISSGATDVANSISSGAKDVVNTIGSGISSIGHSIGRMYRQKALFKFYFILKANGFVRIRFFFLFDITYQLSENADKLVLKVMVYFLTSPVFQLTFFNC